MTADVLEVAVGDVLAVRTGGWAAWLINLGAALRGRPAMNSHCALVHHRDSTGQWWGLEGKPGGVGWTTLDRYLASPFTVNNVGQPKTEQQRYDVAVAAEALLATPYDWVGIARDGLKAIGAPLLLVRGLARPRAAGARRVQQLRELVLSTRRP